MANKVAGNEVDAKELERALGMWRGFTKLFKYGTISTIVILILMSWFLL